MKEEHDFMVEVVDLEESKDVKISKNTNNEQLENATMTSEREHETKKQDREKEEPEMEEENFEYETRDFPDPFFCPLTGKIMKDPVVHPDGTSFERSAVADAGDDVVYYTNRALQAIIQQEILRRNLPLQRTMDSVKKSFLGLVTLPLHQDSVRPLSDQFYCSITHDIMKHPMIDPDGQTFDRRAIVNWIRIHENSPTTRNSLSAKQLYKNNAIKDLLDEELARDDESMNGSIRRWKEQTEEDDEDEEWDPDAEETGNAATTPISMEEIEERQRQRHGQERVSRHKMYMILVTFFIACMFLYRWLLIMLTQE